tara:strand:+ start:849 stop:1145 length:297 start_codon:yes stop_codon:yes gene_type:complete
MVEKDKVIEILGNVVDPELNIDIWNLGLIYEITIDNDKITVTMSLTSPTCPYGEQLMADVKNQVSEIEGVNEVEIDLTFEPAWSPEKMSEEAKMELGV